MAREQRKVDSGTCIQCSLPFCAAQSILQREIPMSFSVESSTPWSCRAARQVTNAACYLARATTNALSKWR